MMKAHGNNHEVDSTRNALLDHDHLGSHGQPKNNPPADGKANSIQGLTTAEVEMLYEKWGYNELPSIVVPLWYIFLMQFTGTMPYMLELACILSLAVSDWVDFAIIAAMILCNGYLGFHEELKAKESLEELTSKMEQKICCLRDGHAVVRIVFISISIFFLSFFLSSLHSIF
jgi:magnesium-transporting ATPase (P-type)